VADPSNYQSALSIITSSMAQLAGAAILAVGTWAVTRFVAWLEKKTSLVNQQNEALITANFDDALRKSLIYGLGRATAAIEASGWDDPQVKSQTLQTALAYIGPHFPGYLKAIGIDPNDQNQMNSMVGQALDRAFPNAVDEASKSPATPPRPPEPAPATLIPDQTAA
jgi:hypothetical protein